jgi:hypothetical protein
MPPNLERHKRSDSAPQLITLDFPLQVSSEMYGTSPTKASPFA